MTIEQARERVAAGIAFLDSDPRIPDNWRDLIDVDRLDLDSDYDCCLGQLSPHVVPADFTDEFYPTPFSRMFRYLWPELPQYRPEDTPWEAVPSIMYGFDGNDIFFRYRGDNIPYLPELTIAWREALVPVAP